MNDDIISRSALKKAAENLVAGGAERLKDYYENGSKSEENEWIGGVYDVWELIISAPTVEQSYQVPKDYIKNKLDYSRPHGEWHGNNFDEHSCLLCGHPALYEEEPDGYYEVQSNFCPNCGANMRGGK